MSVCMCYKIQSEQFDLFSPNITVCKWQYYIIQIPHQKKNKKQKNTDLKTKCFSCYGIRAEGNYWKFE